MNTIDNYLTQLNENTILYEGVISNWVSKLSGKSNQLQTAFDKKDIKKAKQLLGSPPVKGVDKIKKDTFSKVPDLKKEYNSNLVKYRAKDDKAKTSLVLGYTIAKRVVDDIGKQDKSTKMDGLHSALKKISTILKTTSSGLYSAGALTIPIVLLGKIGVIALKKSTMLKLSRVGMATFLIGMILVLVSEIIGETANLIKPKDLSGIDRTYKDKYFKGGGKDSGKGGKNPINSRI